MSEPRDELYKRLREQDIRTIDLQFTDVAGMIKTVTIDADYLPVAAREGVWFDGSAVEGFARVAESDMYLFPDLDTFTGIPWEPDHPATGRVARVFCDVCTPNGQPFAGDPRGALRRAAALAESMGDALHGVARTRILHFPRAALHDGPAST